MDYSAGPLDAGLTRGDKGGERAAVDGVVQVQTRFDVAAITLIKVVAAILGAMHLVSNVQIFIEHVLAFASVIQAATFGRRRGWSIGHDREVFAALLKTLLARSSTRHGDYLLLGLHETDALLRLVTKRGTTSYITRLYHVCWEDGEELRSRLDGRPSYLELGCL